MEAQAITEVEIKEQQLVIAQWMQVPEEIIGILNQERSGASGNGSICALWIRCPQRF